MCVNTCLYKFEYLQRSRRNMPPFGNDLGIPTFGLCRQVVPLHDFLLSACFVLITIVACWNGYTFSSLIGRHVLRTQLVPTKGVLCIAPPNK